MAHPLTPQRPKTSGVTPRGDGASKQQGKRRNSASNRHAVVAEGPRNEMELYAQRIHEITTQRAKLERDYQQKIAANRREIRTMHDENTHLRSIRAGHGNVTDRELDLLDKRKYLAVRNLNRLSYELRAIEDSISVSEQARALNEKELSNETTDSVPTGNASVALRIQRLEKRLDSILGQQRFAACIKNSFVCTLEDLLRDDVGRDTRIQMMQQCVNVRKQEYARLVMLYHNATADYNYAHGELKRFNESFQQTRRMKDKALAERRARVESLLRETQLLEQRQMDLQQEIDDEHQRIEELEIEKQIVEQRRQCTVSASERLTSCLNTTENADLPDKVPGVVAVDASVEDEERLRMYEAMFVKMMRSTEAKTLEGLVHKFREESSLRSQLVQSTREEQQKLEQLEAEVKSLKEKIAQQEICGSRPVPVTMCMRTELETYIEEALRKRDVAQKNSSNSKRTLLEFLGCTDAIAAQMSTYRTDVVIPPTNTENLLTNLQMLEKKIFSLADDTVDRNTAVPNVDSLLVTLPASNTRIKLPTKLGVRANAPAANQQYPNADATDAEDLNADAKSSVSESLSWGLVPSGKGVEVSSFSSSDSDYNEEVGDGGKRSIGLLDNDEPLGREQVKRLAVLVLRREQRRRLRE